MKISKIETFLLEKKLASGMRISRGGFTLRQHLIVRITTDSGLSGLGEGIGTARYVQALIDAGLGQKLIGLDPFDIESIRRLVLDSQVYFERKGSAICAASALEMACWDIKGKALNLPVYQLLGGQSQTDLKAYASDVYWEEDPNKLAENALRIAELGYGIVKAHLGAAGPDEDARRIEAIRRRLPSETKLMIDLNAGYSPTQAKRAIKLWSDFDLFWLEEPVDPNFVDAMAELRKESKIPIAAGENEFRVFGFKDLFDAQAVDYAMPDIGRAGGIQETLNICALAEVYGIAVSPHNFSSGVLLAATMHLMTASPWTALLECDSSQNAVYWDFFIEKPKFKNGHYRVPNSPGLGVELKPEILEKYALKTDSK